MVDGLCIFESDTLTKCGLGELIVVALCGIFSTKLIEAPMGHVGSGRVLWCHQVALSVW